VVNEEVALDRMMLNSVPWKTWNCFNRGPHFIGWGAKVRRPKTRIPKSMPRRKKKRNRETRWTGCKKTVRSFKKKGGAQQRPEKVSLGKGEASAIEGLSHLPTNLTGGGGKNVQCRWRERNDLR